MLSMGTVGYFEGLSCVWGVEIAVVGVIMIVNKGVFLRQNNWNAQDHSLFEAVSSSY